MRRILVLVLSTKAYGSIHHSYKIEEQVVDGNKQMVDTLTSIHWRLPN